MPIDWVFYLQRRDFQWNAKLKQNKKLRKSIGIHVDMSYLVMSRRSDIEAVNAVLLREQSRILYQQVFFITYILLYV